MSHCRAATLITAIILSTTKVLFFAMEAATRQDLVPTHLCVLVGISIEATWTAYWALRVKERLEIRAAQHSETILNAITEAVEECGQRAATDARLDLMRKIEQPNAAHLPNQRPHLVT